MGKSDSSLFHKGFALPPREQLLVQVNGAGSKQALDFMNQLLKKESDFRLRVAILKLKLNYSG